MSYTVGAAACGVVAPFCYALTVTVGARFRSATYSHVRHAVDELTERNAPNRRTLQACFLLYNALAMAGAVAFVQAVQDVSQLYAGGAVVFLLTTIVSVLATGFPLDAVDNGDTTLAGRVHVWAACATHVLALLAMGLVAGAALSQPGQLGFAVFGFVWLILTAAATAATAHQAAARGPRLGLFQRLAVGGFLLWLLILDALVLNKYW